MKALYLDCFAGISGNMMIGALLDLGVPEDYLSSELAKLSVGGYKLNIKRTVKAGVSAVYLDVETGWLNRRRHLPDIRKIIAEADLPDRIKEKSEAVFLTLGKAEAKVHGTTIDKIHFHEVGAVDTIVDIVGTVIGLEYLDAGEIYTSPLQTGVGFVKCAHGRMPIPAPATAELLTGIPHYNGEITKELVTPTGAALLKTLGTAFDGKPRRFVAEKIGYGAGSWDLEIPNVLRAQLGEISAASQELLVAEANIDDLNPQIYGYVMDRLLTEGALDVWLDPIIMKKGRPAVKLSVLAARDAMNRLYPIIFQETTTIGVRSYAVEREVLDRRFLTVNLAWGPIPVKVSSYRGHVVNAAPEYEDCRNLAEKNGIALKTVREQALCEALRVIAQEEKA